MELKEYQTRALDALTRWREQLAASEKRLSQLITRSPELVEPGDYNHPLRAWQKLADNGDVPFPNRPYVERTDAMKRPIPHICFRVPTGGGKTLLATVAIERLNISRGLVLWMVPSNAIFAQTKAALKNLEHPYRQALERASGGNFRFLEKNTPFDEPMLADSLCVMLISLQSANRKNNKEFLKIHQSSGAYMSFFPDIDDKDGHTKLRGENPDLEPHGADERITHSLHNVIKLKRPLIILDEAHKAYGQQGNDSDEYRDTISNMNPRMIIELSATPKMTRSNILVDVPGSDLKTEEMIKLPIEVRSEENVDWRNTLDKARAKLDELHGAAKPLDHNERRYIRPIAVVRVERTGKDQQDGEHVHAYDVRDHLIKSGVPECGIAIKSAQEDNLGQEDLLSRNSEITWIITKDALKEGWDCPFAYVLVLLDRTTAPTAITQMVGRVMRQPDARLTGQESLDRSYVYCGYTDVDLAVKRVKTGLELEGMGDLHQNGSVVLGSSLSSPVKTLTVQRRQQFRHVEIFLPKVRHRSFDGGWEELDYRRHILPEIDLGIIGAPEPQSAHANQPREETSIVDLDATGITEKSYGNQPLDVDESVNIAWYARHISDVLPNPFQAARIVQDTIKRMRNAKQNDSEIYAQRNPLVVQLRSHVKAELDKQAEQIFLKKIESGDIQCNLETTDHNYRMRPSLKVPVPEDATQLQHHGEPVQLPLFEKTYAHQYNNDERSFALYLDQAKALQWWHRVAVRQDGEYFLRGWRQDRIWPDFVAVMNAKSDKPGLLIFETKGTHLEGHEDTDYKKRVLKALQDSYNAGTMTVHNGPAKGIFRLVFFREGFPDAETAFRELQAAYA